MKYWQCLYLALFVKSANNAKIKPPPNIGPMQYFALIRIHRNLEMVTSFSSPVGNRLDNFYYSQLVIYTVC